MLTFKNTMVMFVSNFFIVWCAKDSGTRNYCPYFKNRAPSQQTNLENCTWFRDNSCCLNEELNEILASTTISLQDSSSECSKHTTYLMCYVCAPNQNTFYRDETLTVCAEFCERWFTACINAKWKGFAIRSLYSSGREFCEARKFLIASKNDKRPESCYTFGKTVENNAYLTLPNAQSLLPVIAYVFVTLVVHS